MEEGEEQPPPRKRQRIDTSLEGEHVSEIPEFKDIDWTRFITNYNKRLEDENRDLALYDELVWRIVDRFKMREGEEECVEGFKLLQHAAYVLDQREELFVLGWIFDNGVGVTKDVKLAVYCFERSAAQGYEEAQYNLGCLYGSRKEGVGLNVPLAIEYLDKAAERNHPESLFNLGHIYAKGTRVPQDWPKALEYYGRAADMGDIDAQYEIGRYYSTVASPPDDEKAVIYYRMAAEQGAAESLLLLAGWHLQGRGGLPLDYRQAWKLYKLAANQEPTKNFLHLLARRHLARYINPDSAPYQFFLLAERKGVALAKALLGVYDLTWAKDEEAGLRRLEEAMQVGEGYAFCSVGVLHVWGRCSLLGHKTNFKKAGELFYMAIAAGYDHTEEMLGYLYRLPKDVTARPDLESSFPLVRDQAKAYSMYQRGARQGHNQACKAKLQQLKDKYPELVCI